MLYNPRNVWERSAAERVRHTCHTCGTIIHTRMAPAGRTRAANAWGLHVRCVCDAVQVHVRLL